jgi:hypothetical protein
MIVKSFFSYDKNNPIESVAQPGGGKWAIAHFIWRRFTHQSFYQEVLAH